MIDDGFDSEKEDVFVGRDLLGMELESTDLAKAIELYELNVKDGFDGSHPIIKKFV